MITHYDQLTAEMLASQFTENTGTHFLDSGGAYGRAWQRNQGKVVQDFLNAPSVSIDHKYQCYSINMYQWLLSNLTYDSLMQRRFELIIGETNDPHLVDAETFAEKMHDGSKYELRTFNSYNGESLLDGVIQGVLFTHHDQQYIALQIHGGCDVRGGYTAPKMYAMDMDEWHSEVIEFYCNAEGCEWGADLDVTEWIERDGSFTRDPWEGSEYKQEEGQCPRCGNLIEAEARLGF